MGKKGKIEQIDTKQREKEKKKRELRRERGKEGERLKRQSSRRGDKQREKVQERCKQGKRPWERARGIMCQARDRAREQSVKE